MSTHEEPESQIDIPIHAQYPKRDGSQSPAPEQDPQHNFEELVELGSDGNTVGDLDDQQHDVVTETQYAELELDSQARDINIEPPLQQHAPAREGDDIPVPVPGTRNESFSDSVEQPPGCLADSPSGDFQMTQRPKVVVGQFNRPRPFAASSHINFEKNMNDEPQMNNMPRNALDRLDDQFLPLVEAHGHKGSTNTTRKPGLPRPSSFGGPTQIPGTTSPQDNMPLNPKIAPRHVSSAQENQGEQRDVPPQARSKSQRVPRQQVPSIPSVRRSSGGKPLRSTKVIPPLPPFPEVSSVPKVHKQSLAPKVDSTMMKEQALGAEARHKDATYSNMAHTRTPASDDGTNSNADQNADASASRVNHRDDFTYGPPRYNKEEHPARDLPRQNVRVQNGKAKVSGQLLTDDSPRRNHAMRENEALGQQAWNENASICGNASGPDQAVDATHGGQHHRGGNHYHQEARVELPPSPTGIIQSQPGMPQISTEQPHNEPSIAPSRGTTPGLASFQASDRSSPVPLSQPQSRRSNHGSSITRPLSSQVLQPEGTSFGKAPKARSPDRVNKAGKGPVTTTNGLDHLLLAKQHIDGWIEEDTQQKALLKAQADQIKKLKDINRTFTEEMSILRERKVSLDKEAEEMTAVFYEARSEIVDFKTANTTEQVALQLAAWRQGQNDTKKKFNEVHSLVATNRKALENNHQRYTQLCHKYKKLHDASKQPKLNALHCQQLEAKVKEFADIKSKLQKANSLLDDYVFRLNTLSEERDKAVQENELVQEEKIRLIKEKTQLRKDVDKYLRDLQNDSYKIENLQGRVTAQEEFLEVMKKIPQLITEEMSKEDGVLSTIFDSTSLHSKLDELISSATTPRTTELQVPASLSKQLEDLCSKLDKDQLDSDGIKTATQNLNKSIEGLKQLDHEAQNELKGQIAELEQKCENLSTEKHTGERESQNIMKQLEDCRRDLEESRQQLNAKEDALLVALAPREDPQLRIQLQDQENTIGELSHQLQATNLEIFKYKQDLSSLQDTVSNKEQALQELHKRIRKSDEEQKAFEARLQQESEMKCKNIAIINDKTNSTLRMKYEAEKKTLQKNFNDLAQQVDLLKNCQTELDSYKVKYKSLLTEIKTFTAKLPSRPTDQTHQVTEIMRSISKEVVEARKEQKALHSGAIEIFEELKDAQLGVEGRLGDLETENQRLRNALSAEQNKTAKLEKEKSELQTRLERTEKVPGIWSAPNGPTTRLAKTGMRLTEHSSQQGSYRPGFDAKLKMDTNLAERRSRALSTTSDHNSRQPLRVANRKGADSLSVSQHSFDRHAYDFVTPQLVSTSNSSAALVPASNGSSSSLSSPKEYSSPNATIPEGSSQIQSQHRLVESDRQHYKKDNSTMRRQNGGPMRDGPQRAVRFAQEFEVPPSDNKDKENHRNDVSQKSAMKPSKIHHQRTSSRILSTSLSQERSVDASESKRQRPQDIETSSVRGFVAGRPTRTVSKPNSRYAGPSTQVVMSGLNVYDMPDDSEDRQWQNPTQTNMNGKRPAFTESSSYKVARTSSIQTTTTSTQITSSTRNNSTRTTNTRASSNRTDNSRKS